MCHREILQRMMCKWGFENSAVKQNKVAVHERAFWNVKWEKKTLKPKIAFLCYCPVAIFCHVAFLSWFAVHFCLCRQMMSDSLFKGKSFSSMCRVALRLLKCESFSFQHFQSRGVSSLSVMNFYHLFYFFFSQPLKCRQKSSNMATVHSRSLR